jgi:flagellar basal body-associated protein FliL
LAWYDDPIIVMAVALVIITACGTVVFAMRRFSNKNPATPKQEKEKEPDKELIKQKPQPNTSIDLEYTNMTTTLPFRISKSVQGTMANSAKDELRMLDLEREILGDAIRRLYEAQAEGKITELEREKLAASYKQRMNTIKESISKDESIIALHELEGMQEDLMKLFSERFGELTSKVEELRGRIDVKPIREIQIKPIPTTPIRVDDAEEEEDDEEETTEVVAEKKPVVKKRKPVEERPTQKTDAEKRIETIRSEVEKVLDKLGQMEIEA